MQQEYYINLKSLSISILHSLVQHELKSESSSALLVWNDV